jgi:hypothetical protein
MYELDGRKPFPLRVGKSGGGSLLQDAVSHIKAVLSLPAHKPGPWQKAPGPNSGLSKLPRMFPDRLVCARAPELLLACSDTSMRTPRN